MNEEEVRDRFDETNGNKSGMQEVIQHFLFRECEESGI